VQVTKNNEWLKSNTLQQCKVAVFMQQCSLLEHYINTVFTGPLHCACQKSEASAALNSPIQHIYKLIWHPRLFKSIVMTHVTTHTSVPALPLIQFKPYEILIFRCTLKTCTNSDPSLRDCKETIRSMKLARLIRPTQIKHFRKTHVLKTYSHLQHTCITIWY